MQHPPFLALPRCGTCPRTGSVQTWSALRIISVIKRQRVAPVVERLTDAGLDVNVDEDGEDGLAVDVNVPNEAEGVREAEEAQESVGVVLPSQVVRHWASQSQCHLFLVTSL